MEITKEGLKKLGYEEEHTLVDGTISDMVLENGNVYASVRFRGDAAQAFYISRKGVACHKASSLCNDMDCLMAAYRLIADAPIGVDSGFIGSCKRSMKKRCIYGTSHEEYVMKGFYLSDEKDGVTHELNFSTTDEGKEEFLGQTMKFSANGASCFSYFNTRSANAELDRMARDFMEKSVSAAKK